MSLKVSIGVMFAVMVVAAMGLALLTLPIKAAERSWSNQELQGKEAEGKKATIAVDVVLERVDRFANTITARSTSYVIPPHGKTGGAVFMMGTKDSPHKDKATKYLGLPVMPEAKIHNKKLKAGDHVILLLQMLKQGPLVVVGIENHGEPEKIGVDWLDAPGTTDGE